MASVENPTTLTPETAELSFDEQLQTAGLVNVPSHVREWIKTNDVAMNEVKRLMSEGFGNKIQNDTTAQGLLTGAFAEAMALEQLRKEGAANQIPLDVDDVIQSLEPHTELSAPNDLSSLDSMGPASYQEAKYRDISASQPAAAPRQEQAAAPITTPVDRIASAIVSEAVAKSEVSKAKEVKEKRNRLAKIGGAALIGLSLFGFGAGIAENAFGPDKDDRATSQEVNLAAEQLTTDQQKEAFFAGAVDVHNLPGRVGNNFGPSLSEEDTRIDTPETRQKTIETFDEMLKGNVDILVSYMYTFNMAGPQIDETNAAQRIQELRALAAHLKDPKNVAEHYQAYQDVKNVVDTVGGGAVGSFGPSHISWFESPDGLGLDNNVEENGAVYREFAFTLPGGNVITVKILLHCHLQPATEELQTVPVEALITQPAPVVEQPPVQEEQPPQETPPYTPPTVTPPTPTPPTPPQPPTPPEGPAPKVGPWRAAGDPGNEWVQDEGTGRKPLATIEGPATLPPTIRQSIKAPVESRSSAPSSAPSVESSSNAPRSSTAVRSPGATHPDSGVGPSGAAHNGDTGANHSGKASGPAE